MRVKFIKDHKEHRRGQVADVSRNEAFGLIDSGVAMLSKDMAPEDVKTKKKAPDGDTA